MSDLVTVTDEGPVRVLRMNRPEKKNALTLAMYDAMAGAIESAAEHPALLCLLIAGGPQAFCAGNDIGDFVQMASQGGALTFILLRGIGQAFVESDVDPAEVRAFLTDKLR